LKSDETLTSLVNRISTELQTFEYQWEPDLSGLSLPTEVPLNATALRFAFGERLFNAYAQEVHGIHVLQSKRLALAEQLYIGAAGRDALANPAVLNRLATKVNERMSPGTVLATTEVLPSFAGYLLAQRPTSPRELLEAAAELRAKEPVTQHRR